MSVVLEIGDRAFTAEDLVPLLVEYQLLPQLTQEIILEQAVTDIECSDTEKTAAYNQFCQQNQLASEEQVQAWLEHHNMSREELKKFVVKKLKIAKYKEVTWGDKVESYFLKRKPQLDRVVYSLIRTDKPEIAQELYFRIREGESTFSELATEYSLGLEAQTGGLIGPVEMTAPHPKIAQMLSTSQPGQVLPPTRVEDWLVIVRLENYLSAKLDPPMRQRMIEEMFREWIQQEIQQKVKYRFTPVTNQIG
jgi:parvulin-like peptidyl-prolyl isomerase